MESKSDVSVFSEPRRQAMTSLKEMRVKYISEFFAKLKQDEAKSLKPDQLRTIENMLQRQYELVVIGNTNVGKSTFLN